MVKGIKKIKWSGVGIVKSNLSTPNKKVVIAPDQLVFFEVEKWYDATPETDKKKNITWIFQDQKTKTIVLQKTLPVTNRYGIKLPKNLCGPFEYYLEASLSGKRDLINKTGLLVSGHCTAKIVSSKLCTSNDGKDVRKEHFFNYGETVYLNLMTEGLNGNLNLSIDVFRNISGKDDPCIFRYTSIDVIDGEVNLEIKNTLAWHSKIKNMKETEEFYVKVFDPANRAYITDNNNDTIHARFLRIKNKTVPQEIKPPTNMSPLKTGEPDKNAARFDPCKFETISIIEDKKEDGKTTKVKALIFDNGKNLKGPNLKKEPISKSILFEFEKYEITAEAKTTLNNTLQFLLEHQFSSIKINGHACVIGKENYNQKLSQQRSDAVKKLFVDGGLDARLITSVGLGEVNPTDDKKGRDNIKYRDEKTYKDNRRVDISFNYYSHDAQTIIYETITPSKDKIITIDITEYQNKSCFREKGKHKKNIKITSPEYSKAIDQVTNKLDFPVKSDLTWWNPSPLQYIWPRYNLTKIGSAEQSMDSANNYFIHVHSCRYFSNDANSTVQIKAYPDIKWSLEFFLNLTNDLSVKWQNKNEFDEKALQKKSGKIGAERRWKQKDASIGFSLKAKWDNDKQTKELKAEYETKFKKIYDVFNSIGSFADGVTNKTKGKVSNTVSKSIPASFTVKPPNLSFTGDWFLAHPKDNKTIIGTDVTIGLHAKPLIGLEVTIDLLGAIAFIGGEIFGLGPGVLELYNAIQGKLKKGIKVGDEKNGLSASVDIYMDLIITSTITINTDINFNTAGKPKDAKLQLETETKLKVELKVGVKIKGEAAVVIIKVKGYFEASASAEASVTFAHTFNYDEKGLYYRPKLGFDGMNAKYVVKISISLAMKIVKDKKSVEETRDGEYTIADGSIKDVIPPFDVIKELEQLFDIKADIPLIKN